jgi:hypothetical protein
VKRMAVAMFCTSALVLGACGHATARRASATPSASQTSVAPNVAASAAPGESPPASRTGTPALGSSGPAGVPRYAHIVMVVMENHSQAQVLGGSSAPFIRQLARAGLTLTKSVGAGEPSQPNYLALFSGSTQGLSNDSCPNTFTGPNLAGELIAQGLTFTGYSEGLPAVGYTGCSAGEYARKHNPWVDFPSLPGSINQPFSAFPKSDFTKLSTVSIVVPNLQHDMHDGPISAGDSWLQGNIGSYADWALHNNSLLIITWDESGSTLATPIPTVLYGARLQSGTDGSAVTHYRLLRTIEAAYGLAALGASAQSKPLAADWQR